MITLNNPMLGKLHNWSKMNWNSKYKILVFDWWEWTLATPGWDTHVKESLDEIIAGIKKHDICFFVINEILKSPRPEQDLNLDKKLQNMMTELNNLNVFYITLSEDSLFPTDESKTFHIPWFIENELYTSKNTTIDFDYRPKDFTFNMLLGADKNERTKMFKTLHNESHIYSTYFGHKDEKIKSRGDLDDTDIWNNLTNQDLSKKLNTMEVAFRENRQYAISRIVPESIYNNSHFDIVAESQPIISSLNFTTEKTGKPLSTGRFFIWYNSPHKVKYLRKFGFELQDYLCDYDSIIDNDKRLETILELIKEIGDNENYIKKIYKKTKNARIHNQEVYKELMTTTTSKLSSWINGQIKEKAHG